MEPGNSQDYEYNDYISSSRGSSSAALDGLEPPLLSNTEQSSLLDFLSTNFAFHLSPHDPEFISPPEPELSVEQPPPPWPGSSPAPHLPPISTLTGSHPVISTRPGLSPPQKRMNHILSEQKRRNQIRESYATLSLLLEGPEGGPGSNPKLLGSSNITREQIRRGQIKGKRGRARGGGKKQGKAGTLFRAVEYATWLREGNDMLKKDIEDLKARVGMAQWQPQPV